MDKKKTILIGVVVVLVVFLTIITINPKKNNDKSTASNQSSTSEVETKKDKEKGNKEKQSEDSSKKDSSTSEAEKETTKSDGNSVDEDPLAGLDADEYQKALDNMTDEERNDYYSKYTKTGSGPVQYQDGITEIQQGDYTSTDPISSNNSHDEYESFQKFKKVHNISYADIRSSSSMENNGDALTLAPVNQSNSKYSDLYYTWGIDWNFTDMTICGTEYEPYEEIMEDCIYELDNNGNYTIHAIVLGPRYSPYEKMYLLNDGYLTDAEVMEILNSSYIKDYVG